MKIGCTLGHKDIKKLELIAKAGFDYAEVALNGLAECSEEEYTAFIKAVKENKIPCEAANCLFPGTLKLCDETFDENAIENYLEKAFKRAKETGIKTVVFGSGGSRKIPGVFPREKAVIQLEKVCKDYLEPIAEKYGITVVIEPLNKNETNIFNSVAEVAEFVARLGLKNVKCLADSYHMDMENEPYSNVKLAGNNLKHTHIANPEGRVMPFATDNNNYDAFFNSLKEIGYAERMSVEAEAPKNMSLEQALANSAMFLRSKTQN